MLLAKLPVALRAQPVYFGLHPTKQLLRRLGWNPCPLKVPDFSAAACARSSTGVSLLFWLSTAPVVTLIK